MAFALNFHYDPEKNRDDLMSDNGFKWGEFDMADKKCTLTTAKASLILKSLDDKGNEKIIFNEPVFIDPTKKHMLAITYDDKELAIYLDSQMIEAKFPAEYI